MKQTIFIALATAALAAGQGTPVPKFTGPTSRDRGFLSVPGRRA